MENNLPLFINKRYGKVIQDMTIIFGLDPQLDIHYSDIFDTLIFYLRCDKIYGIGIANLSVCVSGFNATLEISPKNEIQVVLNIGSSNREEFAKLKINENE